MNNLLTERKDLNLVPSAYGGANGNFGILEQVSTTNNKCNIKWYNCREEFANYASKHFSGFLFYHNDKTSEDIAEFMERFEVLLEQGRRRPINRSTFQKVNANGVIHIGNESSMTWINAGPFWTRQVMRHSMFTMLLRCANMGYTVNGDFFQALYNSYNLAMACKSSIARFLDGYTWYTGDNDGKTDGWYNTFRSLEGVSCDSDRWKILIKPKKK